jgi:hypothetical protein
MYKLNKQIPKMQAMTSKYYLATCLDEVFPHVLDVVSFPWEVCKAILEVKATL